MSKLAKKSAGSKKIKREPDSTEVQLEKAIENITHTGSITLDPDLLKEIKTLCRNTPSCLVTSFSLIMKYLRKKHSEVRLSAFQLCAELFKRAHIFRQLVIPNLEEIADLSIGLDPDKRLPTPKHAAVKLKNLALQTIPAWKNEFGKSYKMLMIGYDYLVRSKNVDFDGALRSVAEAEEARIERDRRDAEIKERIVKDLSDDFEVWYAEIEEAIETISNCVSLLLPTPDDFFLTSMDDDETPSTSTEIQEEAKGEDELNMRLFGINPSYNLVINIDPSKRVNVDRTSENSAVLDNLKENLKLAKKRLFPLLKKWENGTTNVSLDANHELVKKISTLKDKLERCVSKSKQLRIDGGCESSSDDEDDMEEVVKEGYEPAVLPIVSNPHPYFSSAISTPGTSGTSSSLRRVPGSYTFNGGCDTPVEDGNDATVSSSKRPNPAGPSSSKDGTCCPPKKRIATVGENESSEKLESPVDVDLNHLANEELTAATFVSVRMDKWGSGDMEMDEIGLPDAYRTRVVEYPGRFEPVTRACRAPMPSGALCPRMDRYKCPFHGKIVPRDERGRCITPEDEVTPSTSKETAVPEWQDPKLLAQLKAATGIDLKMPEKKGRRKGRQPMEKRHPGLTDLKKLKDTTAARLKKKLFSKATMRRLTAAANKLK